MSIKKVVSLSFLLIANMLILTHVLVPHHYHEDTGLCFVSHCRDSKEAHRHENNEPQNHHEENANPDICTIDVFSKTTDKNIKIACHNDCMQTVFLSPVSSLNIQDYIDSTKTSFLPCPCFPSCHIEYVSQSLGLRAPPVC